MLALVFFNLDVNIETLTMSKLARFQRKSPAIIMLCRLFESGVCKCAHYWPGKPNDVEADPESGLEIKLLSEEVRILCAQGCQIFLSTTYQNGQKYTN
jgi:hypothetical protein